MLTTAQVAFLPVPSQYHRCPINVPTISSIGLGPKLMNLDQSTLPYLKHAGVCESMLRLLVDACLELGLMFLPEKKKYFFFFLGGG